MSTEVAENTSLLTYSPMENVDVSAAGVMAGTVDFILGFSNSSIKNFFQIIQFVILHAQTMNIS